MDEEPDRAASALSRPLSEREADTLAFMLSVDFDGGAALREQASRAVVVEQCTCGCATIDLAIPDDAPAAVDAPPVLMVQTHARDMDAQPVGLFLFVRDGRLSSLEIVWYDQAQMTAEFPDREFWEPPIAQQAAGGEPSAG